MLDFFCLTFGVRFKSDLKSFLSLKVNGSIYRITSSAINSHQYRQVLLN